MIQHFPTCHANYPEKVPGERAQQIEEDDLGDEVVRTCVDCGAFEIVPRLTPKA